MIHFSLLLHRGSVQNVIKVSRFATNTFLVWMLIAAIIGFIFPNQLATISGFVPYLLGIVMLGMGLTIDPKRF